MEIVSPKVNVHITTYNRLEKLKRCLRSVFNQTYPINKIIVVDDCSTDGTDVYLSGLIEREQILYVRHDCNMGNANARNSALEISDCDLVAFLDDDDYWIDENKLYKQVNAISNFHNTLCFTSVRILENDGDRDLKINVSPDDVKRKILVGNSIIYNSSVLVSRNLLIKTKGFDPNVKKGVDSDFFRNIILNFKCNIEMLKDVTTVVDETGFDRMTPLANLNALERELDSNLYCFLKYEEHFNDNPKEQHLRRSRILKLAFKFFIKSLNAKKLSKVLKAVL